MRQRGFDGKRGTVLFHVRGVAPDVKHARVVDKPPCSCVKTDLSDEFFARVRACLNFTKNPKYFVCFCVSERGICLPTVSLWLLFVYIEASVRLREFKSLPFHLDLCRPFAAHW